MSRLRHLVILSIAALWISTKLLTHYLRISYYKDCRRVGILSGMIWGMIALYERVIGRVCCPSGFSTEIASIIGIKQGFPLTFFDEISELIDRGAGRGSTLSDYLISLALYADDTSSRAGGSPSSYGSIGGVSHRQNLTVNLGKTKVIVVMPGNGKSIHKTQKFSKKQNLKTRVSRNINIQQ